jgi:hypothetical protein
MNPSFYVSSRYRSDFREVNALKLLPPLPPPPAQLFWSLSSRLIDSFSALNQLLAEEWVDLSTKVA